MAKTGKQSPGLTDESIVSREDAPRIKIIEEIDGLLKIPEIQDYFFRAILEAKYIFCDKIKNYELQKVKNEDYKGEAEEESEIPNVSKKSTTYFFEMARKEEPGGDPGFKWELVNCKLPVDEKDVEIILNDFLKKVDEYKIDPHRIKDELVHFQDVDKWFLIRFTKNSPIRVVGFVREVKEDQKKFKGRQKKEEEEKFFIKINNRMLKINPKVTRAMKREELVEFLRNNHEFTHDMEFSIQMKRQTEFPD